MQTIELLISLSESDFKKIGAEHCKDGDTLKAYLLKHSSNNDNESLIAEINNIKARLFKLETKKPRTAKKTIPEPDKQEPAPPIAPKIKRQFEHLTLTEDEYFKLALHYDNEDIEMILTQIENYKGNKQYVSFYKTAVNWLKNAQAKGTLLSQIGKSNKNTINQNVAKGSIQKIRLDNVSQLYEKFDAKRIIEYNAVIQQGYDMRGGLESVVIQDNLLPVMYLHKEKKFLIKKQ